jgi:hypothetical protein
MELTAEALFRAKVPLDAATAPVKPEGEAISYGDHVALLEKPQRRKGYSPPPYEIRKIQETLAVVLRILDELKPKPKPKKKK